MSGCSGIQEWSKANNLLLLIQRHFQTDFSLKLAELSWLPGCLINSSQFGFHQPTKSEIGFINYRQPLNYSFNIYLFLYLPIPLPPSDLSFGWFDSKSVLAHWIGINQLQQNLNSDWAVMRIELQQTYENLVSIAACLCLIQFQSN